MSITTPKELETRYRAYIHTLNTQNWVDLPSYLSPKVIHNDKQLGHAGYRKLIPDKTEFTIQSVLADVEKREIASRLGIVVDGKKLRENVFYRWGPVAAGSGGESGEWVIEQVWSIVEDVEE